MPFSRRQGRNGYSQQSEMVPLDCNRGWNPCRLSLVEGGNRSGGPVVYPADLTSQATLKEVTILAEIVEQPGKSGFIACPEDCGVFRGAFRNGR